MKVNLFGYTIYIEKQNDTVILIQKINQQIDSQTPNETMGNIQVKVKRIMILRKLLQDDPHLHPILYKGGLPAQKKFVEEHWN